MEDVVTFCLMTSSSPPTSSATGSSSCAASQEEAGSWLWKQGGRRVARRSVACQGLRATRLRARAYSRDMSDLPGADPIPPARRPSLAPLVVVAVFFVVAVTLVLIGAQRSAEPAPSVAIGRPGTPDQPRPVTVLMRDYLFDPTPLVLVAGETIRLTVFSAGMTTHELVLGDRDVQEAWARADAAATPPAPFATAPPASVPPDTGGVRLLLSSGQSATVDYTVPASGELLLLCHLPGHIAKGMIGRVELRTTGGPVGTLPAQ